MKRQRCNHCKSFTGRSDDDTLENERGKPLCADCFADANAPYGFRGYAVSLQHHREGQS
jgi:hypothetical protein